MADNPVTQLDAPISGDRAEQLADDLQHHKSRVAIKTVVEEYVESAAFATRVKAIMLEALESTVTYEKISDKVGNQVGNILTQKGLKNRNFLWPLGISIVAALAAIGSLIVSIVKPN